MSLWWQAGLACAQSTEPCITIQCPADFAAVATDATGAIITFNVTASTRCARVVTVTCVPASGSLFPIGTTTVACLASDDFGNTAPCEFHVTVVDATPPVISAPTQVVAQCSGPAGAVVDYAVTATDDVDPAPRLYCVPPPGSLFPIGTNTVTCVAVDARNNQSTVSFPVIVEGDCTADCLAITCPRDIQVSVRSGTNRVVTFSVTASNLCGGFEVPVYCEPPSGWAFPLGTTKVECLATNLGAQQKCSFNVTVLDTTAPTIKVSQPLTVACQGYDIHAQAGAAVSYPLIVTDNSDPAPQITCVPPSGSWFPLGTNEVQCTARDAAGNESSKTFQVVVNSGPNCEVSVPVTELAPDNWGFELGLIGWIPSGDAFAYQPVVGEVMRVRRIQQLSQQMEEYIGGDYWPNLTYRIGFKGMKWIGTADNYAIPQGGLFDTETSDESLTGELLSKPFTIEKHYISFLIGGTSDPDHLRVELLVESDAGDAEAIRIGSTYYHIEHSTTGHGRELMRRVGWNMNDLFHHVLGKKARIRIVDASATGHLNVDDFQFVDTHPHYQRVNIGGKDYPAVVLFDRLEYDWDSPVWGFADLHTHPMSYLGFGEKVMHGQPDGGPLDPSNIELALDDCNCTHGGVDVFHNLCGNYMRQALEMGTDDKGNDPHREGWASDRITFDGVVNDYGRFRQWPIFSTSTHQQMWYEWIKRAYDGGLRTMVALCVNNALLGSASQGPGPLDDLTVGDHQIQALKEFVARHDDFLEIAYDPFQLRDIVRRNKLAIIIGSELDDIGNLVRNPYVHSDPPDDKNPLDPYSKTSTLIAIDHLYDQGVRYIFPVHLVNNKFGGTPIANVMLNIANRYMNGEALQVEPADPSDHIHYWLPEDFDLSALIDEHKDEIILGAIALPAVLPLLPALTEVFNVGTPPGSGAAIGAGLLPIALLGAVSALPGVLDAIPTDVWPIDHHYPPYPGRGPGEAPWGHRNARGLTKLGEFAIQEMMKRGMMIDVDHMSQKTLAAVFDMAEANPIGYPLNSGHNNFRPLAGSESGENNRSNEQMARLRELGGLFGVGYENGNTASLSEAWLKEPNFSTSKVENDCAGTSKTVGQIYLYALETMSGRHIAFGTDIDGFIPSPGPRFGPNSDFANASPWDKPARIRDQDNGVLYEPKHGRPIVGPAFIGEGVDPEKWSGFGSKPHLDGNQNLKPGYAYSQMQRDFFVAMRIFYFLKGKVVDDNWPQVQVLLELERILQVLDGGYQRDDVRDFATGLVNGIKTWPKTSDNMVQRLGYLVYREEVLHEVVPDEIKGYPPLYEDLFALRGVWYDYHHIFGHNKPMKRCQTGPKDWDINFEGVAHYGMLPDLLQDMTNVGMETSDLDPLFQSADDFAGMWTKCLQAADAIVHPILYLSYSPMRSGSVLNLDWYGEEGDRLEQSDQLDEGANWRVCDVAITFVNHRGHATIPVDGGVSTRFYRVSK